MTAEGKQCLLRYLGYAPGAVDGIWGERSEAALARFRKAQGLPQGENPEAALLEAVAQGRFCREADFWQGIRHFQRAEYRCPCGACGGFPAEPDEILVQVEDRLREILGVPIINTSGVRCREHNRAVGGVETSLHLTGKAVDFYAPGKSARELLALAQAQPEIVYAYAIDGSAVHMNVAR